MSASNAGGRQDAGPRRTVAQKYTPPKAIGVDKFGNTITSTSGNYKTINESGKTVGSSFITEGANKSNKDINKMLPGGTKALASMAKPLLAKGAKYSRRAFENLVIGSEKTKGIASTVTRKEWDSMGAAAKESLYSSYSKSRQSGKTDFYGRNVRQEGNGVFSNNGQIKISKLSTSPTTAELSQATSTDATDATDTNSVENILLKKKKTKARGRSMTILSSPRGVTSDENLTLGKKSLLGS